jgi:hypothetical protein
MRYVEFREDVNYIITIKQLQNIKGILFQTILQIEAVNSNKKINIFFNVYRTCFCFLLGRKQHGQSFGILFKCTSVTLMF